MARLIGMTDLAPVEEIYVTNFKPVPTDEVIDDRVPPDPRRASGRDARE